MTTVRDRSAGRWLCGVTLLSSAALLVTSCGGDDSPHPHTLVFDIGGSGELSPLTYVIDGKTTTEKSVALPWRKTIQLPAKEGGHTWSLKAHQNSGSSQTTVYVDGKTVISGSCAGDGCATNDNGKIRD